jgi:hypothetical protein
MAVAIATDKRVNSSGYLVAKLWSFPLPDPLGIELSEREVRECQQTIVSVQDYCSTVVDTMESYDMASQMC